MRSIRAWLTALPAFAMLPSWLVCACGGGQGGGEPSADASLSEAGQEAAPDGGGSVDSPVGSDTANETGTSDATGSDAIAADATTEDVIPNDATVRDATTDDATADDAVVGDAPGDDDASDAIANDATADTGALDGAPDGDDGSDGAPPPIPCDEDAGDGGGGSDGGDGAAACPGTLQCCAGFCADTSKDPHNCGSCGNACSSTQFCTGTACDDLVIKSLCGNRAATWSTDPYASDNTAGSEVATTLTTDCIPPVSAASADQDSGMAQDPVTGRPITGVGNTFVAGGGFFGQGGVAYMDHMGLTPLDVGSAAGGTQAFIRNRKTMADIVFLPDAGGSLTAHHDYFVLEVSLEPISGTFCFFAYGMGAPGTLAAGYFVQNNVFPSSLATFTDVWRVYEWTDTDGDGAPSAGDTFAKVQQGN